MKRRFIPGRFYWVQPSKTDENIELLADKGIQPARYYKNDMWEILGSELIFMVDWVGLRLDIPKIN